MNINEQKKLRAIAKILPNQFYNTSEPVEIKGEDLLLCGTKEVAGKDVDPEKTYIMKSPVYHEANHYRRLKRNFIAYGKAGIKSYVKAFVKHPESTNDIIDVLFK